MFKLFYNFDTQTRLFFIATGMMGLSNGIFDAVYNFYLKANGIDEVGIGQIYAISMLMMSSAVIVLMIASIKISAKKILIGSSVIYALPFLALPFCTTVYSCSVALGLILSGMIAILSTGNSLFGLRVGDNKTKMFGLFFVFYLGAAMLASFIVAIITKYSPFSSIYNYKSVLLIAFISAALMVIVRLKSIHGVKEFSNNKIHKQAKYNLEWRNLAMLFIASFLLGGSITLIFRFANILFNQAYSLDVTETSVVFGFDKIVSIFGALCAPLLVKKYNIMITLLSIGILTFLTLISQSFYLPLAIFIILYFGRLILNYALMPLLDTLTISGFDKSRVLISSSTRQLSFYFGGACSAILYGWLFQNHDWVKALIYSALMALAGVTALFFVKESSKSEVQ